MPSSSPHPPGTRLRLRPGVRVSVRGADLLQVGIHPGHRLVLPATVEVRRLLALLGQGLLPARLDPADRDLLERLQAAGLVSPAEEDTVRHRVREAARVAVDAPPAAAEQVRSLLDQVGLPEATAGEAPTVSLVVTCGAEPRRERIDPVMRADRPHLLVTALAGVVRVGPCVVPGLTACLRCVDEHLTDHDPRHPLVVEQHLDADPHDVPPPLDLRLGLCWAVRDLVALVEGDQPSTWSATVELTPLGPVSRTWRRHPRCGCAWGDALAG